MVPRWLSLEPSRVCKRGRALIVLETAVNNFTETVSPARRPDHVVLSRSSVTVAIWYVVLPKRGAAYVKAAGSAGEGESSSERSET